MAKRKIEYYGDERKHSLRPSKFWIENIFIPIEKEDETMFLFQGSEQIYEPQTEEMLIESLQRQHLIGEVPPSKEFQRFEESLLKREIEQ